MRIEVKNKKNKIIIDIISIDLWGIRGRPGKKPGRRFESSKTCNAFESRSFMYCVLRVVCTVWYAVCIVCHGLWVVLLFFKRVLNKIKYVLFPGGQEKTRRGFERRVSAYNHHRSIIKTSYNSVAVLA